MDLRQGDKKSMYATVQKITFLAGCLVCRPSIVLACGACMDSYFEFIIPSFWYWVLFAMLYFMSLSIYSYVTSTPILGIPGIGMAITIIAGMFVLSTISGFNIYLVLLLPGIGFIIFATHPKKYAKLTADLKFLHGIGMVSLVGLLVLSVYTHYTSTYADMILKDGRSPRSKIALARLNKEGVEGLDELRKVVLNGDAWSVAMATDGLVEHGNPAEDVPIMIDAYEKLRIMEADKVFLEKIEANLSRISGLNLPVSSSPDTWRLHWIKVNDPVSMSNLPIE